MNAVDRRNPYVGLKPFDVADSLFFFGRRKQTVELLELLHQTRFLGLVGSSGCGKSSLVRAGLIPALLAGFLVQDRDCWRVAVMKPGHAPLLNLSRCLLDPDASDAEAELFAERIAAEQSSAVIKQLELLVGERTNVLLLIDQFEEVFAFRNAGVDGDMAASAIRRHEEAEDFVTLLLSLLGEVRLPVYVALTMRSDFLGDCDVFPGLPEAMNASRYLVPRLPREQLAEAIEGPAKLMRANLHPRLLDRLLNDVGDRVDQLPVLQHALMRTWNAWEARKTDAPIEQEDYERVGTLERALELHASEAIREVDEQLASSIFKALTDTDPQGRRVRRATSLNDLVHLSGSDERQVLRTIDKFVSDGRFFIVTETASVGGERRIDISHESLIRQWPQLRTWVDEEREARDRLTALNERSWAWVENRGELLTGVGLKGTWEWWCEQDRLAWATRYLAQPDVSSLVRFLAASRRARALARGWMALLALGVLLAFGVIAWQRNETQKALVQRVKAEAAVAKLEAEVVLARVDSEQLNNLVANLKRSLDLAKDDATRAKLEAELQEATFEKEKARQNLARAGAALARTQDPSNSKACNCPPGDPLCSCL